MTDRSVISPHLLERLRWQQVSRSYSNGDWRGSLAMRDVLAHLREHGIAPILDLIFLHNAFQKERIRLGEGFGRGPATEQRHISARRIGEGTYSNYLVPGNELLQEGFVAGIDSHDFVAS